MQRIKLLIILTVLLYPYMGARASFGYSGGFGHETASMGHSFSSMASRPSVSMSSSSAMLPAQSTRPIAQYTSFGATAGVLPARSIMHSNMDNAFAEQSAAFAPGRSIRREGRDDPDNPSEPPGHDTPVGDVPWAMMMLLVAGYVIRLRLHTKVQKKRARTE